MSHILPHILTTLLTWGELSMLDAVRASQLKKKKIIEIIRNISDPNKLAPAQYHTADQWWQRYP